MHGLYRQTFYSLLLKCGKISSQQIFTIIIKMIIQYHNGITDSSVFKFQIICEKKTRVFWPFWPWSMLKVSCTLFFVSADSRLSIPYENFFADSVFVSIGICIKPVDFSSVVFFKYLCNNSFNVLMKLIHYY
jgi:hypothetical protein